MFIHTFIGRLDYYPGQYYITFPAGETTASFNIVIIDDNVVERDEKISLTINSNTLPNSVVRSHPYSVSLYIEDDDKCKLLMLYNHSGCKKHQLHHFCI